MSKNSITLADGSVLRLAFTMDVWEKIEDEIGTMEELGKRITQPGRIRLLPQIAAFMAQPREDGAAWTAEEIRARMTPPLFAAIQRGINQAIAASMRMETEEKKGGIVDETLEELRKNAGKAD